MFDCKINVSTESFVEMDCIDANDFVDNALVLLDKSAILLLNLLFSYDSTVLICELKLTI